MSRIVGSLKSRRRTAYRHIITLASSLKYTKNSQRKRWKLSFSTTPLLFDAPSPRNLQKLRVTGLHFCRRQYGSIFIQIFVVGSERRIFSATVRIGRSRSSKVVDFGTNRKGVCNFLLVINSNEGPIVHRFWDTASYWLKIVKFPYPTLI